MEAVPDMDALLDELEEVVVGNKPSHPKNSKPCADQTVVIELPLHLRKLSEKVLRNSIISCTSLLLLCLF